MNRRTFLGTATTAAVMSRFGWAASEHGIENIGLELYTVRDLLKKDFEGTLAQVAKIGYKEVEFAGYHNHPATEVRDMLKANGLAAPSVHVGINVIEETPDKLFEESRIVGHQWLTVPSLSGEKNTAVWTADGGGRDRNGEECRRLRELIYVRRKYGFFAIATDRRRSKLIGEHKQ